jgi:hypothetical protein
MFVLGIDNAEFGALVVSEGAQGDDTAFLSCLECVSYAGFFKWQYLVSFFDFLGAALDKIMDCRVVGRGAASFSRCRARGGQCPIAHRACAARSKLVEIQCRGQALTSENEGLKKDLEIACTAHDAVVKDKAEVQKTECAKLERFQNSVHKKLAELRHDTEASIASLEGRSIEFPTDASLFDFFEWFRTEVTTLPTAFTECNENITCYVLIGVFQMLAGEGCEHLSELKKLAHSCNASILQNFPMETGRIAKRLVMNWWNMHGMPYCMQKIEEENRVSFGI